MIGILGAGGVARALAAGLRAAGREVVVGARSPAGWDVPGVRAVAPREAAGAADVVVNALPGDVSLDVLAGLSRELQGKVVLDVANAVVPDPVGFAVALRYPGGSLAAELQRVLPGSRVVKALNTAHVSLMAAPGSLPVPPDVFLSGDDPAAKDVVRGLLRDLGWPDRAVVDLGGVETARGPESFVLMVGDLVRALGPVPFAFSVAR
ncbi:NADPH-dependent F420 reductase [Actinocorallia herbida]|uniref:NADPH-dependent F420 reductase n=1 Tax=Actinocorallia herbida TaxID=58109 RepID=UPI001B86D172|nr:NAD(P)-binding domain-containing protein [Actinocorallia herbida]